MIRVLMIRNAISNIFACAALFTLASPAFAQKPVATSATRDVAENTVAQSGRIESLTYNSALIGQERHILVYLPLAYDTDLHAHFPVLFLRHGGGDGNEHNWIDKGNAAPALDQMFAKKLATPMVVVFTYGQLPDSFGSNYDPLALDAAANELVHEVIPLIESKYRISKGGANRAVAGLSMGAGQSFAIAMRYPNEFSAIGVFSAGTFGVEGSPNPRTPNGPPPSPSAKPAPKLRPFDAQRDAKAAMADPQGFNRQVPLVYISVGDTDPRAKPTAQAITMMRSQGINIVSAVQNGAHEWPVWKIALTDFVPRLFAVAH